MQIKNHLQPLSTIPSRESHQDITAIAGEKATVDSKNLINANANHLFC